MPAMPDTENAPLEEPGKRNGEGSGSIMPHLQRQALTQHREPWKRPNKDDDVPPDPESDQSAPQA